MNSRAEQYASAMVMSLLCTLLAIPAMAAAATRLAMMDWTIIILYRDGLRVFMNTLICSWCALK